MLRKFASLCTGAALVAALSFTPVQAQPAWNYGAEYQNAQFSFSFGTRDRDRDRRDRFERRGNYWYYNGHRGYRDRRPGWRQHRGFWFPPQAFSFSFNVDRGGVSIGVNSRHRAWCEDRYRSYRASDNTFQPYNGPRRACISPYRR